VEKMLDKGTFGTVFRAYDTKHKEPVAVKVLSLCVCVCGIGMA